MVNQQLLSWLLVDCWIYDVRHGSESRSLATYQVGQDHGSECPMFGATTSYHDWTHSFHEGSMDPNFMEGRSTKFSLPMVNWVVQKVEWRFKNKGNFVQMQTLNCWY